MSDSKEKFILALDHGTSGCKSAIVSTKGNVIDWVFKEVPLHILKGGGAEQNPDDWWNGFLEGAKELINRKLVPVEDIIGVCNTSQWSGTVPVDKDGKHLMNGIIWMDTRGAEQVRKFHKSLLQFDGYAILKALKWIKRTGGCLVGSGKDPIAHILWIKENLPEIYDKTYKFLEPQDYMNLKLTGKFATSGATIHMHWLTDIRDIIKDIKIGPKKIPGY